MWFSSNFLNLSYLTIIILGKLVLVRRISAMVVTLYPEKYRDELFNDIQSNKKHTMKRNKMYEDPLKNMSRIEKMNLWSAIMDSNYFRTERFVEPETNEITSMEVGSKYEYKEIEIQQKENSIRTGCIICFVQYRAIAFASDYFFVSYAFTSGTYFFSKHDDHAYPTGPTTISLRGLIEPAGKVGDSLSFKNQTKLEELFLASQQPEKRKRCPENFCNLRFMEQVRVCGQIFESKFYRDLGLEFSGEVFPLKTIMIALKDGNNIKYNAFECQVQNKSDQNKKLTYYISPTYTKNDDFGVSAFVAKYSDDDENIYLNSYATLLTSLSRNIECELRCRKSIFPKLFLSILGLHT